MVLNFINIHRAGFRGRHPPQSRGAQTSEGPKGPWPPKGSRSKKEKNRELRKKKKVKKGEDKKKKERKTDGKKKKKERKRDEKRK